ncbi:hypothetical protein V8E36_005647 [Tilletia maclaganii]
MLGFALITVLPFLMFGSGSLSSKAIRAVSEPESFKNICETTGFHCVSIYQHNSYFNGPQYKLTGPEANDSWTSFDRVTYVYEDPADVVLTRGGTALKLVMDVDNAILELGGDMAGVLRGRFEGSTEEVSSQQPVVHSPAGPHTIWVEAVV